MPTDSAHEVSAGEVGDGIHRRGMVGSRRRWLGGASAAAMASVFGSPGTWGQGKPDSREVHLEQACRRNLKLIFDAVSRYASERGEHPYRLSDLAGTYIDQDVLICPSLVSRGRLQNPRSDLVSNIANDPLTFYVWEYSLKKLDGTKMTNREFKARQRQTAAGDWVPMVRCQAHMRPDRPLHLNLAFGGAVYESGLYWETHFRHLCPLPYLGHSEIFFSEAHPPRYTADIPKRSGRAAEGSLDLSDAYNALLSDPWNSDESSDRLNDWVAQLGPEWLFEHDGISFDVRGVVQVEGDSVRLLRDNDPSNQLAFYPRLARPIAVNRPVSRLHALAGVIYAGDEGTEVGRLTLFRGDREVESLSLLQGGHVRPQPTGKEPPESASRLVYHREPAPGTTKDAPHAVYHVTWPMKAAGTGVDRLEFSALDGATSPFLMAVTVEV